MHLRLKASYLVSSFLIASAFSISAAQHPMGAMELRVDNLSTPLGIDDPAPSFSWQMNDPARGARQTAYEVRVATSPQLLATKADVWSSGRVTSDKSINVKYAGPALKPSTR